jgi:uncharacterized protein YjbI with pentapeptide repeats
MNLLEAVPLASELKGRNKKSNRANYNPIDGRKQSLGEVLEHCAVNNISLKGANLKDVDLRCAKLDGLDLQDANLIGAKFLDASCFGVNFKGAILRTASFVRADIRCADFTGADTRFCNMTYTRKNGAISFFGKPKVQSFLCADGEVMSLDIMRMDGV